MMEPQDLPDQQDPTVLQAPVISLQMQTPKGLAHLLLLTEELRMVEYDIIILVNQDTLEVWLTYLRGSGIVLQRNQAATRLLFGVIQVQVDILSNILIWWYL